MSMHARYLPFLLVVFALAACGEDATDPDGKGAEEEELIGGKQDSFFKPTEHGALVFGLPNQAEIVEDERFHAWEFELHGPAKVGVQSNVSQNLDTVMYLYRRNNADESWGRFKQKNDDWKGDIWSRIELDAQEAGQYRIIVKPFKRALRGSFTVTAECEGEGCRAPGETSCEDGFADTPAETDFGQACAKVVAEILTEPATSGGGFSIGFHEERCSLPLIEQQAVDFYRGYWDDIFGFDELSDGDDVFLNVGSVEHGDKGWWVSVDSGGDEDTLIFVFDADDQLVLFYHDEQSPTSAWFCAAGEPDAEAEPSEDCVAATLYDIPHSTADKTDGSTTPATAKADMGTPAWAAVAQFASDFGLGQDATVAFDGETWTSEHSEAGGKITVSRDGDTATYLVADRFGEIAVPIRIDADGDAKFVCGEFDN
jgi:hypothetical protein